MVGKRRGFWAWVLLLRVSPFAPFFSFSGLSFVAIFCCLSSLFDMLWGFVVFTHLWRFCSFGGVSEIIDSGGVGLLGSFCVIVSGKKCDYIFLFLPFGYFVSSF